jgi:muramoyltetrapeptide carboxypeptidase
MKPAFLQPNDQIRIISPSGSINPEFIDGATKVLTNWGLQVTEGEFARNEYGRFAGTREQRIADLQNTLNDSDVKAILCSRGGYGIAQIIDKLDFSEFVKSPKWLIGFSDVTILHNAITNLGFASIHGIMAKHLTELSEEAEPVIRFREMLFGTMPTYTFPSLHLNRRGSASGKLIGGNLSVLMALRGSQFDLDYSDAILFIEDIAEKPYHIDRMMQNLRFSGALASLSGLIVGQFSDCEEDPLMMQTISEIILDAVQGYDFPVCFDFPAGHVDYNLPLMVGTKIQLEVSTEVSHLRY